MPSESKFGINGDDFRKAAAALEKRGFDKAAGRTVAFALRRSANVVRRHVRAEARPHRKTGRLSGNVRTRFVGVGLAFVARVKSTGPVAHLIVGGVRPHKIGPPPYGRGSSKVMALHAGKGKSNSVVGFATVVSNPGFKGDPYFHRGVERSAPEINAIIDASAQTMVKELAYRMRGHK